MPKNWTYTDIFREDYFKSIEKSKSSLDRSAPLHGCYKKIEKFSTSQNRKISATSFGK